MKKFTFLTVLLFPFGLLSAQNLIPNPSFENLGTPPCSWITSTTGFNNAIQNWTMPSNGSTDIFTNFVSTTCFAHNLSTHASRIGQQNPRSGNAQSAILTYGDGCGWMPNYREYLQTPLTSTLTPGQNYDFSFYVSLADESDKGTENIGVYFSTSQVFQGTCFVLSYSPQFNYTGIITNKSGWTQISGTVTATAGWNYMVIGNFFSNAATSTTFVGGARPSVRYFFDDASVTPAVILPAENINFKGDRLEDGKVALAWQQEEDAPIQNYSLQRSTDGLTWTDVHRTVAPPGMTDFEWLDHHPPAGELIYRLRYVNANGEKHATEAVRFEDIYDFPYRLDIVQNPVPADLPVQFRIAHADDSPAEVLVYDLAGKEVFRAGGMSLLEANDFAIPAGTLQPEMYLLQIKTMKGPLVKKLVVR